VSDVLPAPPLSEDRGGCRGQAEDIVQLAVDEQATIRGDPGAVKLELEAAVEGDPQGFFRFTRRAAIPHPSGRCYVADSSSRITAGRQPRSRSNGKSGMTSGKGKRTVDAPIQLAI
jgi:hypothetical protein